MFGAQAPCCHDIDQVETFQASADRQDSAGDDHARQSGKNNVPQSLHLTRPIDLRGFDDRTVDLLQVRDKDDQIVPRIHPQDDEQHRNHRMIHRTLVDVIRLEQLDQFGIRPAREKNALHRMPMTTVEMTDGMKIID